MWGFASSLINAAKSFFGGMGSGESKPADGGSSSSSSAQPKGIVEVVEGCVYKLCEPKLKPPQVEVVFIHGLQIFGYKDAYWKTWVAGQKDGDGKEVCWPLTWLGEDLPGARIWSLSYDSSALKTDTTGRVDGFILGESLVQNMVDFASIGQEENCPVVFVCHSLGGIVVKEIVIKAHTKFGNDPKYKKFLQNIRGFHFYATPHDGSRLADWAAQLPRMGEMVNKLKVINKELGRTNDEFERIEKENYPNRWQFAVVAETHKTRTANGMFSAVVVEETSARHGYKKFRSVEADHFGVCKPKDKVSSSYMSLISLITLAMGDERLISGENKEMESLLC